MDVLTWLIELGVGIGCLAGGLAAVRSTRLRLVGALLIVAGAAATIHAGISLISLASSQ